MIWLVFVAKFVQNGSSIFPETPAQFPWCHLAQGNAKTKNNRQFQPDLLFWRPVSVLCINTSCWRTLALFAFFPELRNTLQFTFYCQLYLFFTANPLHFLSFVNWQAHQMTEGQVELFLKHWVFFSWYKTMRRRSQLRRGRWDSRRGLIVTVVSTRPAYGVSKLVLCLRACSVWALLFQSQKLFLLENGNLAKNQTHRNWNIGWCSSRNIRSFPLMLYPKNSHVWVAARTSLTLTETPVPVPT